MINEKPPLCRTPTQMAFKIQELEEKIINLTEEIESLKGKKQIFHAAKSTKKK